MTTTHPPMTGPCMFRPRPATVVAIRYQPGQNCAAVHAFLGWEHDEEACTPDAVLEMNTPDGVHVAYPGDWVVRGEDGVARPVPAAAFDAAYELSLIHI